MILKYIVTLLQCNRVFHTGHLAPRGIAAMNCPLKIASRIRSFAKTCAAATITSVSSLVSLVIIWLLWLFCTLIKPICRPIVDTGSNRENNLRTSAHTWWCYSPILPPSRTRSKFASEICVHYVYPNYAAIICLVDIYQRWPHQWIQSWRLIKNRAWQTWRSTHVHRSTDAPLSIS